MKKLTLLLFALVLPALLHAETVNTPWTAPAWVVKKDTTTLPGGPYATPELCKTAAVVAQAALGKSANITCQGATSSRFTVLSDCPAAPASSQTNACTGNNTPPWTQSRIVTRLTRTKEGDACWSTSAWAPTSAPATACQPPVVTPPANVTWAVIANEGVSFTLSASKVVRYGYDQWPTYDVDPVSTEGDLFVLVTLQAGTYVCGNATNWPVDPKPGSNKKCWVSSEVVSTAPPPPVTPPASSASMSPNPFVPVAATAHAEANAAISTTAHQRPLGGWSQDMLIATTEVAPASDIGAFRTGCQATKIVNDDPIVYPGQAGSSAGTGPSHPHIFFGNTAVSGNTTSATLVSQGNSTCRGGTVNKSAYWVPAMVDMRTKKFVLPLFESNFYYKSGYAVASNLIQDVPLGLRMIAGDAKGTPAAPSGAALYACVWSGGNSNWTNYIPTDCPGGNGSWLIVGVDFPQCWDGVNLDSPDHKSHMRNPVAGPGNDSANGHMVCPSSHPVALPQIAYQVLYPIPATGDTAFYRLSSDAYDPTLKAGYSGHGDYMMAWKPEIVTAWTVNCDRAKKDCHSHLLGDGRAMVIP